MAAVEWSDRALEHLREVYDWIARDSPRYARRMIETIERAADRLERFPESDRILPELPRGPYRDLVVGQYRVVYRYEREEDVATVVAVVHGRRRLLPLLDDG